MPLMMTVMTTMVVTMATMTLSLRLSGEMQLLISCLAIVTMSPAPSAAKVGMMTILMIRDIVARMIQFSRTEIYVARRNLRKKVWICA